MTRPPILVDHRHRWGPSGRCVECRLPAHLDPELMAHQRDYAGDHRRGQHAAPFRGCPVCDYLATDPTVECRPCLKAIRVIEYPSHSRWHEDSTDG